MEKTCERCGKAYEAKDRRGRWCPDCKLVGKRQAELDKKRRGPISLICRDCGRQFEALRSDAFRCPECRAADGKRRSASYELRKKSACPVCGKSIARKAGKCMSCAQSGKAGELNNAWKGGRTLHSQGYIELRIDGQKVLEHRRVWEQAHGPLPKGWVVHHLNGIKDDNRLENLVGMAGSHHGPRAHIDPSQYEARIRELESMVRLDLVGPETHLVLEGVSTMDPNAGMVACEGCGGPIYREAAAFPLCDNCAQKEADKKAARAARKAEKEGTEPPEKEEAPAKEGAAEQQVDPKDPSTFSESGKVNPNQQDKPVVTGRFSSGTTIIDGGSTTTSTNK